MDNDVIARTGVWQGLNRMPYINDGEMRNMKNLCSDAYPFLSTRKGRLEHKITVYVPGVVGDGYFADVPELPEASEEYAEKIVKVTCDAEDSLYVSGEFYYFEDGKWVKGNNNEFYKGTTEEISKDYRTDEFERATSPYDDSYYKEDYNNHIYKYIGENYGKFKKGKTYQYIINIEPYWYKVNSFSGLDVMGYYEKVPEAKEEYASKKKCFIYEGDTTEDYIYGQIYRCYLRGYGEWKEISDIYNLVREMPEDGNLVRYIANYSGGNVPLAYYTCEKDYSSGEAVYFFVKKENYGGEYILQKELPEASEDNYGQTYYSGIKSGDYNQCVWVDNGFKWVSVSQPIVEKNVSFETWLTDYMNIGLNKIYELGELYGKLAVLFEDGSGNIKLYYEHQLFPVQDVSTNPGKKLITMGNKLIVGECGSYLYRDKETKEIKLFPVGKRFSRTVSAVSIEYAEGKYKHSSIDTENYEEGHVKIVLYEEKGQGYGYKEVYEGLVPKTDDNGQTTGVDFKIEINGNTFYLETTDGCAYEPNKHIGGSVERKKYADVLTIRAKGMREAFSWSSEKGGADITFASTASYLLDVEVWKKRLWGYTDNYLQGTVQDVFDVDGQVDWTTGDNTYTEAISQPIWQGGDITGLAALSEALILFKEDSLSVFSGNYPAVMQASTISARGLSGKDRDSVAVANQAVYYLNRDGVYRFNGYSPTLISGKAKINGTAPVASSDGRKYRISLMEPDGSYALYVYDINLGLWHKEDDTKAVSFVNLGGSVIMATDKQIYMLDALLEDLEWEAELWYDEGTYAIKKYKGFTARGNLGDCEIQLKADDGDWESYAFIDGKLDIRTEPFMCRELSVKLKGKGVCEIKTLDRRFEVVE